MTTPDTTAASEPEAGVGELRVHAARGVKWAVVQVIGATGGRLLFTMVLARFLGPDDFGVAAQATIYIALALLILDQGFGAALVQRHDLHRSDVRSVATLNLALSLGLCVATIVLAPAVAAFFRTPELTAVLRVLGCGLIVKGLTIVPMMMTRRLFQFRQLAIVQIAAVVLSGVAGLIAVAAGADYWALVVQQVVGDVLVLLGLLALRGLPRFGLDLHRLRAMFGFSIALLGSRLLLFVGQNADNIAVGRVLGATALAYYALAYRLQRFPMQLFGSAVNDVSLPIFSRLQHDAPRRQSWFLTATRFITVTTWPVLVLIAVGAEIAVPFALGERWTPAVVPLQLLSLGALAGISRWLFAPLCTSCGRTDIVFGWSAVSVSLQVVAFLIAVHWGINAVAASLGIVGLVLFVPQTVHVGRAISFSARGFARAHLAAAAGCLALATTWWVVAEALQRLGAGAFIVLAVATIASLGAYLPVVRLVWPTVGSEAKTMWGLTRQRGRASAQQLGGAAETVG